LKVVHGDRAEQDDHARKFRRMLWLTLAVLGALAAQGVSAARQARGGCRDSAWWSANRLAPAGRRRRNIRGLDAPDLEVPHGLEEALRSGGIPIDSAKAYRPLC
jgi:hypothetical protein